MSTRVNTFAAAAYNKVAWLLKYGVGVLGQTTADIMDYMADVTCPGYQV